MLGKGGDAGAKASDEGGVESEDDILAKMMGAGKDAGAGDGGAGKTTAAPLDTADEILKQMMMGGKIIVPGGATYSEELTYFMGTQAALMKSGEVQRRAEQR